MYAHFHVICSFACLSNIILGLLSIQTISTYRVYSYYYTVDMI